MTPVSKFLKKRKKDLVTELTLLDQDNENKDLQLPKNITTLVEADFTVKIINFNVFKNYLTILQERNGIRELKVINLLTEKQHIHYFDQAPEEMSASDGKRAQFYDIRFENNLTFDEVNLRYVLETPNSPPKSLHFNMGTKRVNLLAHESYENLGPKNLKEYHCEKIMVKMRDGFEIPMVIKYDKRFYSE